MIQTPQQDTEMDNDKELTLGSSDYNGNDFRLNLQDQTWSVKVLNQTFSGKNIEEVRGMIEISRKEKEEQAKRQAENPQPGAAVEKEMKKPDIQAGYKLTFLTDKETHKTTGAQIVFYELNPEIPAWEQRNNVRIVDESGVPGERVDTYMALSANRNFSKPKIKAISQGIAKSNHYRNLSVFIQSATEGVIAKCGGTLTRQHSANKWKNESYSDPQWNVFPYEGVDMSQWKQSGDKIAHTSGISVKMEATMRPEINFYVNVPAKLVSSRESTFHFSDVNEAMKFAQTVGKVIQAPEHLNGHKVAHIYTERYLHVKQITSPLFEFTVLGLVGEEAKAMLIQEEDGKLALFSVPSKETANRILTKHLDTLKKPIGVIEEVVKEMTSPGKRPPQIRNTHINADGLVGIHDREALDAQFKKLKALADEFNTQIQEAAKQKDIELDKTKVKFKKALEQVDVAPAKGRTPKA